MLFITSIYSWTMWCFIRDNGEVKDALMKTVNPRSVFVESFMNKLEEFEATKPIFEARCNNHHPFQPFIRRIATAMFNCFAKNMVNERNSAIHAEKTRKTIDKQTIDERKIIKLTSGNVTVRAGDKTSEDCGECKFCQDKKKFGGKGTLKKRCINKEKAVK